VTRFLGHWLAVCGLIAVGWYCWGFQNIPGPVRRQLATAVLRWLWQHGRVESPSIVVRIVYVAVYVVLWLLLRVWRRLIALALTPLLWQPTTVRFSAAEITVPNGRLDLRVPREQHPPPTFVLLPEPGATFRQAKARTPAVAAFDDQTQHLALQAVRQTIPVARFAYAGDAYRFFEACQMSLAVRLAAPPPAGGQKRDREI
jgi:hypothetical protein